MIHLSQSELDLVQTILQDYVANSSIWVFGSRATGNAKKYSDLDLCILEKHPLPTDTLINLQEAFSESDLPFRVDIVEWATLSPEFRQIVQKTHIPFPFYNKASE